MTDEKVNEKKEYEKDDFYPFNDKPNYFWYTWFYEKTPTTKQEIEHNEAYGVGKEESILCNPETEEQWAKARLYEYDGGECNEELPYCENEQEWITPENIRELKELGYKVTIKIEYEENKKSLQVSKMGRKKIINVPSKSKLEVGDNVEILRGRDNLNSNKTPKEFCKDKGCVAKGDN